MTGSGESLIVENAIENKLGSSTDWALFTKDLLKEVHRLDLKTVWDSSRAETDHIPTAASFGGTNKAADERRKAWRNLPGLISRGLKPGSKAYGLWQTMDADQSSKAGVVYDMLREQFEILEPDDQKALGQSIRSMTYANLKQEEGFDIEGFVMFLQIQMERAPNIFVGDHKTTFEDSSSSLIHEIIKHLKRSAPGCLHAVLESFQTLIVATPERTSVTKLAEVLKKRHYEILSDRREELDENPAGMANFMRSTIAGVSGEVGGVGSAYVADDTTNVRIDGANYCLNTMTVGEMKDVLASKHREDFLGQVNLASFGFQPGDEMAGSVLLSSNGLSQRLATARRQERKRLEEESLIEAGRAVNASQYTGNVKGGGGNTPYTGGKSPFTPGTPSGSPSNKTCYRCGDPNHIAKDCPTKLKNGGSGKRTVKRTSTSSVSAKVKTKVTKKEKKSGGKGGGKGGQGGGKGGKGGKGGHGGGGSSGSGGWGSGGWNSANVAYYGE